MGEATGMTGESARERRLAPIRGPRGDHGFHASGVRRRAPMAGRPANEGCLVPIFLAAVL
jgi:hypothetical protein